MRHARPATPLHSLAARPRACLLTAKIWLGPRIVLSQKCCVPNASVFFDFPLTKLRPTPLSREIIFDSGSGMRKIVFQVIQYKPFQISIAFVFDFEFPCDSHRTVLCGDCVW